MTDSQVSEQLERILRDFLSTWPAFPGVALAIRGGHLCWSGAVGFADKEGLAELDVNAPFRIASVTKTFTASAILRLLEERKLELNDSIAMHLELATNEVLQNGGYDVAGMQVEHLLRHTSGLYDYAEDPEFQRSVVTNPGHRWTRADQVRFAVEHGKPLSEPGEEYNYSDTGYVLLGEIIERLTGNGLAAAYRRLLSFDRIGINHTYLETLEPKPPGLVPRAHHSSQGESSRHRPMAAQVTLLLFTRARETQTPPTGPPRGSTVSRYRLA
jgi:D-alanyl-D-alanine carboxypeptidase